eukprot:gene7706-8513_t
MATLTVDSLLGYLTCVYDSYLGDASSSSSSSCYTSYDGLTVGAGLCVFFIAYSVRLTYNFWIKGGYGNLIQHEEDYRWPILRKMMHPLLFLLFHLTFISIYQNVLLFWIVCPVYEIMVDGSRGLDWRDLWLSLIYLVLWTVEGVADYQHWTFQTTKHSLTASERSQQYPAGHDMRLGFFTRGLFRYSRHPNYFAEQSMWVVIYLFSHVVVVARQQQSPFTQYLVSLLPAGESVIKTIFGQYVNWTVLGCIQLILLFQGSMTFSESISSQKYPEYKDYQKTTSQCIPWIPGHGPLGLHCVNDQQDQKKKTK